MHRDCVPCAYNGAKNGDGQLMDALWHAAGVNCEVLQGGTLRVGDCVHAVPGSHDPACIDDGGKPPAFFVRPRDRDPAMREQLRDFRDRVYREYSVKDPAGVERGAASYRAVGLDMWPPASQAPPAPQRTGARLALWVAVLLPAVAVGVSLLLRGRSGAQSTR